MFTYIDPEVRHRLTEQGTLFQIDSEGARLDGAALASSESVAGSTISILGPIPLPIELGATKLEAAVVRLRA